VSRCNHRLDRWAFSREQVFRKEETVSHEENVAAPHRGSSTQTVKVEMTIGIDLGDVWSHYCTLNEDGEVVDRGRFRTTPKAIEKWFTDLPPARVAMEAGTHSIWISSSLISGVGRTVR
jgi:hypothetical protein